MIDEYSCFPFCFPCANVLSSTVIKCLDQLFALYGMPHYVHSNLGRAFTLHELKDYMLRRGVASCHSTPYHPRGNAQGPSRAL